MAGQGKVDRKRQTFYCFSFCCFSNFKLVVGSWAVGIKCVIYFPTYFDLSRSCCPLLESSTNAAQSMPTHLAHAEISYKLCKLSLSIIYIVCYVGNFHLFACEPVCLCAYTCVCVDAIAFKCMERGQFFNFLMDLQFQNSHMA